MKKSTLFALIAPAVIAVLAMFPYKRKTISFHTDAERAYFKEVLGKEKGMHDPDFFLEIDSNILFPTSQTCSGCHGHDTLEYAMVTYFGEDVNFHDDWRSTMMANSAKDPFWRAKVTHEILVNPSHSLELQDKCTSCHAPAGHFQAKLKDQAPHYLLADLYQDTLGLDGVTCQACHAMPDTLLGDRHSGELYYDTSNIRVAYGPFDFAFEPPMRDFVGITPVFSTHILDAGLCAGCHTLITNTVDLQGEFTGATFVEQATYHEWLNSRYDEENDNVSCQSCHMPQLEDQIIIAANYLNLPPRSPYGLHELAGANVTMLKLMRDNKEALGIDAMAEHFDSTIAATLRMLQVQSLDLDFQAGNLTGDTMRFSVSLVNKAGHKFPSGYPSRRAWVEFELFDEMGNSIFHSGEVNADYELVDEDPVFEPHHRVIREESQVQIYEMVTGDVNGEFTNVLERAAYALKDNRLTPQGFSVADPVYDTTQIVGEAFTDPDFNRNAMGQEGTGADIVRFHIPNLGYEGALSARVRVWYQSLPKKWMDPLFEYSSPEIDTFKSMFDAADNSPILIAEQSLDGLFASPVASGVVSDSKITIYPSLSADGRVWIQTRPGDQIQRILVWDASGNLVSENSQSPVSLPDRNGVYFIQVRTKRSEKVQKVIRTGN